MIRLLSIISIILAIVLFPPATLALVSNNAVPGDAAYPIKRTLEDGIYAVASLNPAVKAWFSAARSDRRFKEFSTLVAQGKSASNTLGELVSQTDVAAEEIKQVDDPVKKQELIAQLSDSIDKYSQKLDEVPIPKPAETAAPVSTPTSSPSLTPFPKASPTSKPSATFKPATTPQPTEQPKPTATASKAPTPRPTPVVSGPPAPTSGNGSVTSNEVDDAKKKFEEIKKKLEEEKKQTPLTKEENKDKIEKKGNEGVPTPEPDAKNLPNADLSNPAGSVKGKNEK